MIPASRLSWQRSLVYLKAAVDEARRLGHGYVGPEHLLLAVAERPGDVGRAFFDRFGMSADVLRENLAEVIGPFRVPLPPEAQLRTTQRCDRAVDTAARLTEAATTIDPDHLLRALVARDIADDAVIGALLLRFGVDLDQARAEFTNLSDQ